MKARCRSSRLAEACLACALDPATGLRGGGVVASWLDFWTPLWYAQHVDGRRGDLTIVDDRTLLDEHLGSFIDVIDSNLGRRPVYAILFNPADLAATAERSEPRDLRLPPAQPDDEILRRRGA